MSLTPHTVSIAEILGLGDEVRTQDPDIRVSRGGRFVIRPYVEKLIDGQIQRVQERIYLRASTKRDAIREKHEIMATINHSKYVIQSQMNFGDFLDHYLTEYVNKPENLASSTRAKYEAHLEKHIRPAFGSLEMALVTTKRIDAMLGEKASAGMAWSTRMDLRNILSGIFTQARKWGYWKELNPAMDATVGRERATREHVKLTIQETRRLLDALPEDVRMICEVALYCTLRVSEVLGLQWRDIDLKDKIVHVRHRWYRGDLDVVKSRKGRRDVPIGSLAKDLERVRPEDATDEDFVFSVKTHVGRWKTPGECRDDRDIHQHFLRPAAVRLGIYRKGFGFHAFRREAVTEHGRVIGIAQAQRMAGHTKADMTQEYTLNDLTAQRRSVRAFQRRVRGA